MRKERLTRLGLSTLLLSDILKCNASTVSDYTNNVPISKDMQERIENDLDEYEWDILQSRVSLFLKDELTKYEGLYYRPIRQQRFKRNGYELYTNRYYFNKLNTNYVIDLIA